MTKIGLFDSGVGGLTLLKELLKLMPDHSYVYFGDTARCPYGPKSPETILRYSLENAAFLLTHDIDLLLVACNTASAVALKDLQKKLHVPVLGVIEPACVRACEVTKTKRIGVIGTKTLINSGSYQKQIAAVLPDAHIVAKACPLFVPLVEEHVMDPTIICPIIKKHLAPVLQEDVDTLLLGCTHYPLLREYIQQEMGPYVTIVDPASVAAEKVFDLQKDKKVAPVRHHFFTSDDPATFQEIGKAFLGIPLHDVQKITFS
jgi:glutamate racemase